MLELLALTALLVAAVVWLAMRNGKQRTEVKVTQDTLAAALKAKEIETEVESLPADVLRRRAKVWVRSASDSVPGRKP